MGNLLTFLLPAIAPALTDGVRSLIARFTSGAGERPQNIAERVQLMQAETERLRVLADIDKPIGSPSQWVVDMRAAYRYIAVLLIWVFGSIAVFSGVDESLKIMLLDMCGASLSFIIGERFYLKLTGK